MTGVSAGMTGVSGGMTGVSAGMTGGAAGEARCLQLGLDVHDVVDGGVAVIGDDYDVGLVQVAVALQPCDDASELLVGRGEGAVGEGGSHTRLVVGAVRLGEPDQRNRWTSFGQHVLGEHLRPVLHLRNR